MSKIPKVMRAVMVSKFGGPEVLEVKSDAPVPTLSSEECLVKVSAVGVNPVETYVRSGNFGPREFPYIPGDDVCGTVVSVGADVKDFKVGDRVASVIKCRSGAYAEYCAVNSEWLVHLPKDFDFRKGAAIGIPYFTACTSLFYKAKAKPTETVLVHGASGGVGIATCQLAVSRGMTVYGTAGSQEGLDLASSQGIKAVFNHREKGYADKIMEATNGRGVDVIVEMLGNVNLNQDLNLLAPNGRVVVVGSKGSIEINPGLLMMKQTSIMGVLIFSTEKDEFAEMKRVIEAGMAQGWLNPLAGPEYSLNDVAKAHADVIVNPGTKGKVVLVL